MGLSEQEQRMLAEIESALAPCFARKDPPRVRIVATSIES